MGKNHRHKKDLKADKAKVKLKTSKTKFLPKGQNVTNTAFKIKPIVLTQQLKDKGDVPLSGKNLDVKGLLTRIKHYNENIRSSACEELSSMYRSHSAELRQELYIIIPIISRLIQDIERKVRKAAVKVVKTILELSGDELNAFLNYFVVQLRCAMAHINVNIREDSLLFLDCFLIHDCGFVSKYSAKLLPDFLSMISKLSHESSLGRSVTVNVGSKETSVTWRIKVLSKLHAVLDNILKNQTKVEQESDGKCKWYRDEFRLSLLHSYWDAVEYSNKKQDIKKYLAMVVPLLYQTWIEVVPGQEGGTNRNESTALNEEMAALLSTVTSTFYLLWKYVEHVGASSTFVNDIFSSKESQKFLDHLLTIFPYCQSENVSVLKKRRRNDKGSMSLNLNLDSNCVKENIHICYVSYCILNEASIQKDTRNKLEAIKFYINECLQSEGYITGRNIQYLLEFLEMSLIQNYHLWKKTKVSPRCLVNNTITLYNTVVEKHKLQLLRILAEVAYSPIFQRLDATGRIPERVKLSTADWPEYNAWLSSLPELLLAPIIDEVAVVALRELSRRQNAVFLEAVSGKIDQILGNLDALKVTIAKPSLTNSVVFMKISIGFIINNCRYYMENKGKD